MPLHSNVIIIILSGIIILSYFFNIISSRTRIPSVLLLIGTGIIIKRIAFYYGYDSPDVSSIVKILGAVGLIMIVLEAALDLKIDRSKVKLVRNSFFSAFVISIFSALIIGIMIRYILHESFEKSFIYAIPMSIISSAIVIPSTVHLPAFKKDFVVYESSFSDIIGIMLFNYLIMKNTLTLSTTLSFLGSILIAVIISIIISLVLAYLTSKTTEGLKFILLFAILTLIYSAGEMIHIPSLLVILVFGLILNNTEILLKWRPNKTIKRKRLAQTLTLLKSITAEASFLVRTFFFILFGYTIRLQILTQPDVLRLGTFIVLALLLIRFLYLRFILKSNLFPEILLMPRGLVTILLFYSIPSHMSLSNFNEGILFFVITTTSLLMMIGLLFYKNENKGQPEKDPSNAEVEKKPPQLYTDNT